jgi:hypothetical protein
VDIQNNSVDMVLFTEFIPERFFPLFNVKLIFPERYSGIAGIPWYRLVVLSYEYGIDCFTFHITKVSRCQGVKYDLC